MIVVHRVAWLDPTPHHHDHEPAATTHARNLTAAGCRNVIGPYPITIHQEHQ